LGLALVFVMLVYGGWNEAAYLSGETRGGAAGLRKGLVGGILLVAILYLAVNLAYLAGLGRDGLAAATAPAALVAGRVLGEAGAAVIAAVVALASLSTLNVTTITGARAMCALGRDLPALGPLGHWDAGRSVPVTALLVQGGVALLLVLVGAFTRDGFEAMVAFSAPVFWAFLALVALVPFRVADLAAVRLPAALFAAACLWMLWSALGYARFVGSADPISGWLGIAGLALVAAGIPLALRARRPGAA
ncbi:MAG: amino acid permease, partial [Sphingomonadaceae bacterium]